MTSPKPATVLLLDTGQEWGGGTNSMLELLKRADRSRLRFIGCFYSDYRKGRGERLTEALQRLEIEAVVLPPLAQPLWAKLAKEAIRLGFFWSRALRRRALWRVDKRWRIDVRAGQVAALVRERGADLVYLNNQPSSNLEGYLAARRAGLALVQHCRIDAELLPAEAAIVNEVATAVICVAQGVLESMARQGIRRELLACVHNAVAAPGPVSAATYASPDRFTIGTVCNLMPRKSVDHLLRATARVEARLLIVGDGAERKRLEALAAELGLAEVEFLGFLEAPLPAMAAMDVFAFCSGKEGFPRAVLEAMSLGKPVVAADVVGAQEAVEDGKTGFLYPHGDIDKLAAHLIALRRDPALRERLGAAGRERVARLFSIEAYVTGVSRILSNAAPAPGDGSPR